MSNIAKKIELDSGLIKPTTAKFQLTEIYETEEDTKWHCEVANSKIQDVGKSIVQMSSVFDKYFAKEDMWAGSSVSGHDGIAKVNIYHASCDIVIYKK